MAEKVISLPDAQEIRGVGSRISSFYLLNLANRYTGLEGIRGLSVLMVFFMHIAGAHYWTDYYVSRNSPIWHLFRMLNGGNIGVDIFLMLSGFLIARTTAVDRFAFSEFMRKRIARLLPAHFVVLTSFVLLHNAAWLMPIVPVGALVYYGMLGSAGFGGILRRALSGVLWAYLTTAILLLAAGIVDGSLPGRIVNAVRGGGMAINLLSLQYFFRDVPILSSVTWTLCVEFAFYLTFALLLLIARSRVSHPLTSTALPLLVVLPYVLQPAISRHLSGIGVTFFPMDRCMALVFGVLLAKLHKSDGISPRMFGLPSTIALLTIPVLMYAWHFYARLPSPNRYYLLVDIIIFIGLGGLLLPKSRALSFFSRPLFRVFGSISYSFYLVHALIINGTLGLFAPYDFGRMLVHMVFSLILSFIVASLVYRFLERPYMCRPRPPALDIACR